MFASSPEPDEKYILPFGKASIIKKGVDITIITWGAIVQKSIEAIHELGLGENSVEVVDLRTLNPIDYETIENSISKTGKILVVYEDNLTNGPGSEICSVITDKYFDLLDGPVRRIASKDSPIPYNWFLEEKVLIQVEDIASAINDLLEY